MTAPTSRGRAIAALLFGALAIAFAPIFVRLTGTGPAAAGFWHYGVKFTTVANATILANLSPVFVVAAAWLMLGERPGKGFLAGLALALGGCWAIAAAKVSGGSGLNPALGDGLSIVTAGWYAGYLLCVRKQRARQSAPEVMLWSTLVGAPLILIAALVLHERVIPLTLGGWGACIGLGAVHVAGQGCIAWALGRLPTATASVVVLVQPVLTAVLAWLIFAEAMAPLQVLGGAAALAGVVIAQFAAARTPAEGAA